MVSIFDDTDPIRIHDVPGLARRQIARAVTELEGTAETGAILATALQQHGSRIVVSHSARLNAAMKQAEELIAAFHNDRENRSTFEAWVEYQRDAAERLVLSLDALRRRGDIFLGHDAEDYPPVLAYATEMVMDGRDLPLPSNSMLLRILPPEGAQINPRRRPYVIIDPRAGHGPGIGGFKTDSQVGVALREGHPVYFVAFQSLRGTPWARAFGAGQEPRRPLETRDDLRARPEVTLALHSDTSEAAVELVPLPQPEAEPQPEVPTDLPVLEYPLAEPGAASRPIRAGRHGGNGAAPPEGRP